MDWFYSYFEFTKVWSRRVIAEAVSNTIEASRAGYAVGLVHSDSGVTVREPKLIRVGETLRSEEIDMSADAALLEVSYAQRLLDAARAPAGPTAPTSGAGGASAGGKEGSIGDDRTETHGQPPTKVPDVGPSPESVRQLELRATVGKTGFFDLNRALSWLRDNADDVQVDVSIRAVAPEQGFDRVKLRNGVIEPIEEGSAGVQFKLE